MSMLSEAELRHERRRPTHAVIWDFNGTLVDDLDLVVWTVNRQLEKRGLPPMTPDTYREVFGFPVQDYYRRLGVTFEKETMADLSEDFFRDYAPRLKDCLLHKGVPKELEKLTAMGIAQYVVSAMEEHMLREMLAYFGIDQIFEAAYGLAHQEGDSKVSRCRELLEDFAIDPANALFVGDTDHDAEVANALSIPVALVATGHQSAARLRATGVGVFEDVASCLDAHLGIEFQDPLPSHSPQHP